MRVWLYARPVSYTHLDVYKRQTTKLVVIDTLQRVRSAGSDSNLYANDYQEIGLLKKLADKRHIACLLYTSRCV